MTARSFAALFLVAVALALFFVFAGSEDASAVAWKIHYNTTLSCAGDDGAVGTNDDSCPINDGCAQVGSNPETGAQCLNNTDDDTADADGAVNDGCPAVGAPEAPASCANAVNDDDDSSSPGVTADTRSVLNISSALDAAPHAYSNFAKVRTLNLPPEWSLVRSSDIPDGALRGRLTTHVSLSVLNGRCGDTQLDLSIPLFDATTNINKTVSWLGGGDNLLLDPDGNGFPEYIDKYPDFLLGITDPDAGIWTQGGAAPAMRPIVRLAGHTFTVSGAPASQLEFLIFEPGQLSAYNRPYSEKDLVDSYGYVNVVQLDNPEPGSATPSTVTEFCEPLSTDTTLYGRTQGKGTLYPGGLGNDFDVLNGVSTPPPNETCAANPNNALCGMGATTIIAQTNPAADTGIWDPADTAGNQDTHLTGAYSTSNRDADGDGVNNNEDGYPFVYNPVGGSTLNGACNTGSNQCTVVNSAGALANDYATIDRNTGSKETIKITGVPDGTTISFAPGTLTKNHASGATVDWGDADQDGLEDLSDPAPTTAASDIDGDTFPNRQDNCAATSNPDQADSDVVPALDGGGGDGIGDACDPHPFDATTEGPFVVDFVRDAVCLGTDTDADGWCDDAETKAGSNPAVAPAPPLPAGASSQPEYTGLDSTFTGPPSVTGTCSDLAWYVANDWAAPGAPIDNDGDTLTNAADVNSCAALAGDNDQDGIPNAQDNCPNDFNPEQLNTDAAAVGGDAVGDACDPDDDADGLRDRIEMLYGGEPKVNAHYDWGGFGYDLDGSTTLTIADVFYFGGGVLSGGKTVPEFQLKTALTAACDSPATSCAVTSVAGVSAGMFVDIGAGSTLERRVVAGVGPGTLLSLDQPLVYNHAAAQAVVVFRVIE